MGISLSLSFSFTQLPTHMLKAHLGNPARVAVVIKFPNQGLGDLGSKPSFTITFLLKWNLLMHITLIFFIPLTHCRTPLNSDTFDCNEATTYVYYNYMKSYKHLTIKTVKLLDFFLKRIIRKTA